MICCEGHILFIPITLFYLALPQKSLTNKNTYFIWIVNTLRKRYEEKHHSFDFENFKWIGSEKSLGMRLIMEVYAILLLNLMHITRVRICS